MSVCAGEASATAEDRHRATHLQREPAQDFRSVLNITNADTVPDLKKTPKMAGTDTNKLQLEVYSANLMSFVFSLWSKKFFPFFWVKIVKIWLLLSATFFYAQIFMLIFYFPPPPFPPVSGL